jgi:hypothetical protein
MRLRESFQIQTTELQTTRQALVRSALLISLCLAVSGCSKHQFQALPFEDNVKSETPPVMPPPLPTPLPPPPPLKAIETFTQDESANKVDILIVNDNSYSMYQDQLKMAQKFESFISSIQDIDYQIGMITTDSHLIAKGTFGHLIPWEGTKSKLLTPNTPKASDVFRATIARKETLECGGWKSCPSGDEQPLLGMIHALNARSGANQSFFRDKVDFVVVVLSDEDELSDGPAHATKPKAVLNAFEAAFGKTKKMAAHGIVILPGDEQCRRDQLNEMPNGAAYFATHVAELADLTGGSLGSICAPDFSAVLSNISRQVRRLVGTIDLHQLPKPGTVTVSFTPEMTIPFSVEGSKVIFDTPPPAGARVEISYEY